MDHRWYDMSREEQMKYYWEKMLLRYRLNREKYFSEQKWTMFHWSMFLPGISPLYLHSQMFVLAIANLASEEQAERWNK